MMFSPLRNETANGGGDNTSTGRRESSRCLGSTGTFERAQPQEYEGLNEMTESSRVSRGLGRGGTEMSESSPVPRAPESRGHYL